MVRKRQVIAVVVALACVGLFALEWSHAPRVDASAHVERQLAQARGQLYLGETFEGLPLRTVSPFLYSDCVPGVRKKAPVPCVWVKVENGRVTGSDADQVARARRDLRRVR